MPIYEYACRACGHEFETLVRASETPSCAKCESAELDKRLSTFATQAYGPGERAAGSACGTCGDPRGPGSCSVN